ncbi:hypothetical protein Gorai_006182, partial [Gossypium raimondii]|nr:hypothetical protein [Gossypium raimondii]
AKERVWLTFKYENLLTFYFGCGKLGHGVKECEVIPLGEHGKGVDEFPYSVTLKVRGFGALSSPIIMEDSINGGDSIIMADYEKQVALDNMNTQFGPVSPIEENSKKPKKVSWKQIARGVDQRLLDGKSTENNENIMLECLWIGESTGSKEASTYTEGVYSLDGLLYGD